MDGGSARSSLRGALPELVSRSALMPHDRPFRAGQVRARENFSSVANKLRTGRFDANGIFFWLEWLRVYRLEHKWYTQEIVRRA